MNSWNNNFDTNTVIEWTAQSTKNMMHSTLREKISRSQWGSAEVVRGKVVFHAAQ